MRVVGVVVVLFSFASAAFAQNCRSLPPGPDRRACAMHNPAFQAKFAKCNQLLVDRGFIGAAVENHGAGKFFRQCMHGQMN